MGYTVDALIIDVETLQEKIFPALRAGEKDPLVMAEIQNLIDDEKVCLMEWNEPSFAHKFKGLKKVIATFNSELTESSLGKTFAIKDGIIEKIETRFKLPSKSHWGYESLIDLIEYAIIKNCARYYGNLGSPHKMELAFISDAVNQISNEEKVEGYLSKLNNYFKYYKHGNGGYGEGISGWLNSEEVQALHSCLGEFKISQELKHPKYEGVITLLSIIELASKENHGILIGRDLRMTLLNRYSGNVTKLQLSNHVSGDGCVNFLGQKIR